MMTLSDLKTRIAEVLHRTDLGPDLGNFVSDATERINRRFGVSLVTPAADTDPLPAGDLLYLYAACQSGYEFLNDGDNAAAASDRFNNEVMTDRWSNTGATTDQFSGVAPVVRRGA